MKKYNLVVCGGTFDHFHKGHELFLSYALSLGGRLIVGLTSDKYVKSSKFKVPTFAKASAGKQNSKLIESYEIRKKSLEEFLKQKKAQDRVSILKISDLFGPTLDKNLFVDAIVVSDDTKKGADSINKKRKELGLKELNFFVAPQVYAEDGKLISSARIRNGEINREGKLYVKQIWLKKDLILPENLRKKFKKPFGKLLQDAESLSMSKNSLVITVGDITAKIFNEKFLKPDISIIDYKVARKEKFSSLAELGFLGNEKNITANNPTGYITHDLFSKVLNIFKSDFRNKVILKVEGEEDLAVLPLILTAPLGAIIYYGQPDVGLVKVEVSEKNKNKTYELISRFEVSHY